MEYDQDHPEVIEYENDLNCSCWRLIGIASVGGEVVRAL
jgi:hypothetical protein